MPWYKYTVARYEMQHSFMCCHNIDEHADIAWFSLLIFYAVLVFQLWADERNQFKSQDFSICIVLKY